MSFSLAGLMRILFLGDVVGRTGRDVVTSRLPGLVQDWKLDLVVVNGENAAGGFGITENIYNEIRTAGADAVTLGNHAFDQREALVFIERADALVRPINYPPGTPGRGAAMIETRGGARVLVANVMGRAFMDPLDDPFAAIDRALDGVELGRVVDAIVVDFHARPPARSRPRPLLRWRVTLVWAPTRTCPPPTIASCRRHRLSDGCRHVRQL